MKMTKVNKFVFWIPRILAILFILFLALFSFDVFDSCNGLFGCALALFMHNIPSLVLLVILIISWKHELVGAIIFGLLGACGIIGAIITTFIISESSKLNPIFIMLGVVCTLVGLLFFVGWNGKKKIKAKI